MYIKARDMQDTEKTGEQSTAKSDDQISTVPEEEPPKGTLYYAFIYCTIFLLALFVAVQFEPLIGYRYPVLLLVAAVILLFIAASLQESRQKKAYQSKKQSLIITMLIIMSTCLVLILMIIPENPVLFLLIPLTLTILFLEGHRARCELHNDST